MKTLNLHISRTLVLSSLLLLVGCSEQVRKDAESSSSYNDINQSDINSVLDNWHLAASRGDLDHYINAMTEGSIFMGTDEHERWTRAELKAYAEPHFADGHGWTYRPRDRFIRTNAYGDVAWVDETLDHDRYGVLRGTAVLRENGEVWKIAHYSLTFLIPNEKVGDVMRVIKGTSE